MVREINRLLCSGKTVYARSHPFNTKIIRARCGTQYAYITGICSDDIHRHYGVDDFFNEYGEQIVASREA